MIIQTKIPGFILRWGTAADVPIIRTLIMELAVYEKLKDIANPTPELLTETLFGNRPFAEVILAEYKGITAGFALFFHNYSTFVGKPGLYLEDIYIRPEFRGKGFGKTILGFLARIALERNCGRMEWSVLDWNETAIRFYEKLGARPMDEWTTFRLDADQFKNISE